MNNFHTTQLKVRANKLNTIVTATHEKLGPINDQIDTIKGWEKSAGRVIVHTSSDFVLGGGFRISRVAANKITVASVLRSYVIQIPGSEVFAVTTPDVLLSANQDELFNHVDSQKMERVWASHAMEIDGIPKAFIMSAPVLPHIIRDINEKHTFGDREWARYMHEWLKRYMLGHRYFSADPFRVVLPKPVVAIQEPEGQQLAAQQPAKSKSKQKR